MTTTIEANKYTQAANISRSFSQLARHHLDIPVSGIHIQTYKAANGVGLRRAVISVVVDAPRITNQHQASIVALVRQAAEGNVRGKPQIMITRKSRRPHWLLPDFSAPAAQWPTHTKHVYVY